MLLGNLLTMAVEEPKFDLQVVHDNFVTSLADEDDIILQHYLDSYYELNKYLYLMEKLVKRV